MAVAEKNEAQILEKALEEKAEADESETSALIAKQPSGKNMSDVFERIAEDIQTWAIRDQAGSVEKLKEPEASNWSSPESLQKQQKTALDALYGSGLLEDKSGREALPDEPQFDHLEKDRSK